MSQPVRVCPLKPISDERAKELAELDRLVEEKRKAEALKKVKPSLRLASVPSTKPGEPQANGTKPIRLSARLADLFGVGDQPTRRQSLYLRLELLVDRLGYKAEAIILEAADMATAARGDRGRYFCATVTRRLRESGVYTWSN